MQPTLSWALAMTWPQGIGNQAVSVRGALSRAQAFRAEVSPSAGRLRLGRDAAGLPLRARQGCPW